MVKKKTTIKILDFDEYLGSRLSNPGRAGKEDDLDTILRDTAKMKVRRVKMMELDKYLLQSEQELEKLKRGESLNSTSGPLPSSADFMKMARLMSDLSPEEQKRVANAYAMLRMADKGQVGGSLGLLGPLLGYARQNPGASEEQMIKYLTLMDSQFLKGLETAKVMNPPKQGDPVDYMVKGMELMKTATPGKQDDPLKFLQLVKELVIEGVRNPLLQAIEKSQPQPGVFEQILTQPELWSRFKEIGMFGGSRGDAATSDIDLRIAQITTANTLEMKKLDLEWKKSLLEKEAADTKTNALVTALAPFSAIVAGPVDQRMREFGRQQALAHNPAGVSPLPLPNTIMLQCSCGHQGELSFSGNKPPAVVNCPKCGLGLNVGAVPIGGKPEEPDTGT